MHFSMIFTMLSDRKQKHIPSLQIFIIFSFLNILLWFFFLYFLWRSYTKYISNRYEISLIN